MNLKQLLQRLRIDPAWAAISCCRDDLSIEYWADTLGITANSADLQEALIRFRRANELFTIADTNEWLNLQDMTLNDLVAFLKPQVLKEALAQHLISDDDITRHFLETAHEYERAEISTIVTDEYGASQELLFRLEEGADFHTLARQFSIDTTTAKAGGYIGLIGRADLEPEKAAEVFNTTVGSLIGPFERKGKYHLILVDDLYPSQLDETIQASIRDQLFLKKLEAYQQSLEIDEEIWRLGEG